jgi:hypothetical protein
VTTYSCTGFFHSFLLHVDILYNTLQKGGAGVAQSVYCLSANWTTRVRSLAEEKDFSCSLCVQTRPTPRVIPFVTILAEILLCFKTCYPLTTDWSCVRKHFCVDSALNGLNSVVINYLSKAIPSCVLENPR